MEEEVEDVALPLSSILSNFLRSNCLCLSRLQLNRLTCTVVELFLFVFQIHLCFLISDV